MWNLIGWLRERRRDSRLTASLADDAMSAMREVAEHPEFLRQYRWPDGTVVDDLTLNMKLLDPAMMMPTERDKNELLDFLKAKYRHRAKALGVMVHVLDAMFAVDPGFRWAMADVIESWRGPEK